MSEEKAAFCDIIITKSVTITGVYLQRQGALSSVIDFHGVANA
jgi:hypothetical protein